MSAKSWGWAEISVVLCECLAPASPSAQQLKHCAPSAVLFLKCLCKTHLHCSPGVPSWRCSCPSWFCRAEGQGWPQARRAGFSSRSGFNWTASLGRRDVAQASWRALFMLQQLHMRCQAVKPLALSVQVRVCGTERTFHPPTSKLKFTHFLAVAANHKE